MLKAKRKQLGTIENAGELGAMKAQ